MCLPATEFGSAFQEGRRRDRRQRVCSHGLLHVGHRDGGPAGDPPPLTAALTNRTDSTSAGFGESGKRTKGGTTLSSSATPAWRPQLVLCMGSIGGRRESACSQRSV